MLFHATMFVRFCQTAHRLQVSLTATRWDSGRGAARNEHITDLGSVPLAAPSVQDRLAFCAKLHQRLDALSNRIAATHARILIPTQDELTELRLAQVREDVRQIQTIQKLVDQSEQIAADGAEIRA